MKGFTVITFALLSSAAFGYGQATSVQGPAEPVRNTQITAYPAGNMQQAAPGSISPGTLNYTEGQVSVDGQPLRQNGPVVLRPNQLLSTSAGFAELLLTPGTFLRIGHDSQVRILSSSLVDTEAKLEKGTALVEVDQLVKGTRLAVLVNGGTAVVERKGLYDFNADQSAVRVLDGKLDVATAAGSKSIGKHDQLLLASTMPLKKSDFDSKAVKAQPLFVWSAARSLSESQANQAVAQTVGAYGGWAGPGWYWDPYRSYYSFLPVDGFLYSPFGWGFYSPAYLGLYGAPYGRVYGGFGYGYGRYGAYRYSGYRGRVGGVSANLHGFHGGMAHAGGFRSGRR